MHAAATLSATMPGADDWSSGHHLNNGHMLISPLIRGNRIYGGVDPKTGLTYGFDRSTGEPMPGTRRGPMHVGRARAMPASSR